MQDPVPAQRAEVVISDGVTMLVSHEGAGVWNATPKSQSAFRRWGRESAAQKAVGAIELHTGCKVNPNTVINYNLTVRAQLICPAAP